MTSGVYVLLNRLTGRAYVGASANIEQRVYFHLIMLRAQDAQPDQPAWDANGEDANGEDAYDLKIVEEVDSSDPHQLEEAAGRCVDGLTQAGGLDVRPAAEIRVSDARISEAVVLGDALTAAALAEADELEQRYGQDSASGPAESEFTAATAASAASLSRLIDFMHTHGIPTVPELYDELYGPGHAPDFRRILKGIGLIGDQLGRYNPRQATGQPSTRRPSTKKITMPWEPDTLYPTPNLHGHGTRNLARTVAGDVDWRPSTSSSGVLQALVGETPIAMVDLSPGREGEALMEILHQVVNPRTIQTMVGVCRLIWEKTERQPFNRMATVRLGELARAAGYDPGPKRYVDPEIRRRLGRELKALTSITTLAAEGPFNRKTHQRPPAWVAPLLVIPAILLEQLLDEEQPAPREIDVMLGRNWATAYTETDLVQIAPGFMQLDGDSAIRLAWYYQTEFRYRMTDQRLAFTRPISNICESAGIADGGSTHRGRFLTRLEKWHAELVAAGVLGSYSRNPAPGEHGKHTEPAEIWTRGAYTVAPPQIIVDAYAMARENARKRESRKRLPASKRRPP